MTQKRHGVAVLLVLMLSAGPMLADVKLASPFGEHMVLQRGISVPVWGTASPGEEITVTLGRQKKTTTTGADGKWMLHLRKLKAGGPFEMTVSGENMLTVKDVYVGEVWLCSGQSNMDMTVAREDRYWCGVFNEAQEVATANYPMIRVFDVEFVTKDEPQTKAQGKWEVCSPETVGDFSATAYFFGRELHKKLKVPIGLITSAYGGSTAEAWTSRPALESNPRLCYLLDEYARRSAEYDTNPVARQKYQDALGKWELAATNAKVQGKDIPREPKNPDPRKDKQSPCLLYNGMIAPLIPYAIRGVIWYQGESNGPTARLYRNIMETLIKDWRRAWGQGDFPFLYVQLANYGELTTKPVQNDGFVLVREGQLQNLSVPNTAMVVAIDNADPDNPNNIHPKNKQEIGLRLSLAARAVAYHQNISYSGPIYDYMTNEGRSIRLHFKHVDGGLVAKDGKLTGFAIAGEDKKFVWADAKIDDDTIIVSSPEITKPVAVRYGWAKNPVTGLYNKAGLPASPFRTDGPAITHLTNPVNLSSELSWPAVTRQCRPWTRWWWLGSAVDKENLTRLLTQYRQAGLGGVEICPIYGVKGFEDRFIDFLSTKWMEMLAHTTNQAKRLDLGVDMTTGTGWPFGGPTVSAEIASAKVNLNRYELAGGKTLESELPKGQLQCLMAVSDSGQQINLTNKVKEERLNWTAPPGQWRLYAVAQSSPIQKVKRAAPGGEGNVLDPYSVAALNRYLARFDKAFAGYRGEMPRSHFHDSFEYYGATWTCDFFHQFKSRRGYDLLNQLPAFFGEGPEDTVARVKSDYRETISDLHLAYIQRWTQWCHAHGSISRNQAHGAPGNLLDIYAAADIPETEIFGEVNERKIPLMKFSSSAAHLTDRKLASAESFTWLGEHFQVPLSQVKEAADFLFTAGVNHIFFHGIPYSPAEAPWPGWQFYASVNFGPLGGLWHDLPHFNAYVTRCQSILQSGTPANDVLLYFPIYDIWHTSGELLMPFTVHNLEEKWFGQSSFYTAAITLRERGYAFDIVSDRLLADAAFAKGSIRFGENAYRVVLIPKCHLIPETTLRKLVQLAREGATILVQESLPADVPGFGNLEKRRDEFQKMLSGISLIKDENSDIQRAALGKGAFLIGDMETILQYSGVSREVSVDIGIRFVRRTYPGGYHYFLVNRSERPVDGWVTLGLPAKSAVIMDPRFEDRIGLAALRQNTDPPRQTQVYLQLQPGESCILRTFVEKTVDGPAWRYFQDAGVSQNITGTWKVQFVEGGPELPSAFQTQQLASWTTLGDADANRFAGTARYTIEFDRPAGDADDWLLDLGRVCDSATVKLNGRTVGALWCRPLHIAVGEFLVPGKNTLEVEVTNLAANRIADLDRRKVNWKYFYNINVVNRNYKPLDASNWPLRDSGLLGPVRLQPVKKIQPATKSVVR